MQLLLYEVSPYPRNSLAKLSLVDSTLDGNLIGVDH